MLAALRQVNGSSRVKWIRICKKVLGAELGTAGLLASTIFCGRRRNHSQASGLAAIDGNPCSETGRRHENWSGAVQRGKAELRVREEDRKRLVVDIVSLAGGISVEDVLDKWVTESTGEDLHTRGSNEVDGKTPVAQGTLVRTLHGAIQDLGQQGLCERAWQVFQWMQRQGWCLKDPHVFTTVINLFGDSFSLEWVERIYASLKDSEVEMDTALHNAVLHARSRAGKVEAVLELFKQMEQLRCRRNRVTYNIVMDTCVKVGTGLATVVHLFKQMCEEGLEPDIISYNILLSACISGQHVKEAVHTYKLLRRKGLKPTVVTFTTLIRVHASAGGCSEALKVYAQMVSRGCRPSVVTFNALITAFARQGLAEEAESIFEGMEEFEVEPTVVTFNTMMDMYCKLGNYRAVEQVMEKMMKAGLEPNVITYTTLMSSFKAGGALEKVLNVYDSVKRASRLCNVVTYTEALDACVKCGQLSKMIDILSDMRVAGREPNVVTCSVILSAVGATSIDEEKADELLDALESFETKLVNMCVVLLSDAMDDVEVNKHTKELFEVLEMDDSRTRVIFCTALVDALWALGWCRRAALVLGWVMRKGGFDDICILSSQEWKLDVRRLSTGGSLVALYQWMSLLSHIAVHFAKSKQIDDPEATRCSTQQPAHSPAIATAPHSHSKQRQGSSSCSNASSTHADVEPDNSCEILLPLLPAYWLDTSSSPGHIVTIPTSFPRHSSMSQGASGSPRIVTLVTGWGKLSKQQGSSQVRSVIDYEVLTKWKAPFRPSPDSGRWIASFEALMYWLLRPHTPATMPLLDSPRKRYS